MAVAVQSRLPVELEKPIFEMAAWSHRKNAQNLVRVARRVKVWVDPIFYAVVSLVDNEFQTKRSGPSSLNRFMKAFELHPEQFFAEHVQHICLAASTSFEVGLATSVLHACQNIINLAYGGSIYTWDRVLSLLHSKYLTRLSIELPRPAPDPEYHSARLRPLLTNVTHLDVLSVWPHPDVLDLLPNLTHIALDFEERGDEEEAMPLLSKLSQNENMEVIAFIVRSKIEAESGAVESFCGLEDLRFVPLLFDPDLVQSDWDASTRGEADQWTRAEEAVAARQREHRQYFNTLRFHEDDV